MPNAKKNEEKNQKDRKSRQVNAAERRRREFTIDELRKIADRMAEFRDDLIAQITAIEELKVDRVTVDGATKHELADREFVTFLVNVQAAVKRAEYEL